MRNSEDPLVSPRAILKTCGKHCASFSSDRAQFYKLCAALVRNSEDRRVTAKKSEGCQMRSRASLRAVGCQCAFAAGAGCEHSPYVLARSIPHNGGVWVACATVAAAAAAASACCGGSGGRDGGSGNNGASCGGDNAAVGAAASIAASTAAGCTAADAAAGAVAGAAAGAAADAVAGGAANAGAGVAAGGGRCGKRGASGMQA